MDDADAGADAYWQRHSLLREAHGYDTRFVQQSFQKALRRWTKSAQERQKLESLLQYVSHCADVLEESREAGNASRSQADLDRVEKYVAKIVSPYVSKHVREHSTCLPPSATRDLSRSTSSMSVHSDDMPSIIESDIGPSSAMPMYNSLSTPHPIVLDGDHEPALLESHLACAPIQLLSNDSRHPPPPPATHPELDSVDGYWDEHARLKAEHLASILTVQQMFVQFSQRAASLTPRQVAKVEYMLRHLTSCVAFFNESKGTHAVRPRSDVDQVLASINQLILPYLDVSSTENEYAVEHAALKAAYLADLVATNDAFTLYIQGATNPKWVAHIQAIQPHVQWACQVLANPPAAATPSSMADLHAVYDCVVMYVVPYKTKAAAAHGAAQLFPHAN